MILEKRHECRNLKPKRRNSDSLKMKKLKLFFFEGISHLQEKELEDSREDLIVFEIEEAGNQNINTKVLVKELHTILYLLIRVLAIHSPGRHFTQSPSEEFCLAPFFPILLEVFVSGG